MTENNLSDIEEEVVETKKQKPSLAKHLAKKSRKKEDSKIVEQNIKDFLKLEPEILLSVSHKDIPESFSIKLDAAQQRKVIEVILNLKQIKTGYDFISTYEKGGTRCREKG